jgi:Flp pilus assembly protein TadG
MHFHLPNQNSLKLSRRSARGQGIITLLMLLSLVIFPLLVFLCFEFARLYLAKQELQSASDAAALAAAATLASSDNANPTQAHKDAVAAAIKIFKVNSVLGATLTNSVEVASKAALSCNIGESKLFFEFLNPVTLAVEPINSMNGKVVRVSSCTGGELAFGKYLGINSLAVNAVATSSVPKLDVVICFDVSGSMDDQTPVSFIKRKWDDTLNKIVYADVNGSNGLMKGKLFDVLKPNATGSSVNATAPQVLTEAYWNAKVYHTEYLAKFYKVPGLRSGGVYPEAGAPPGNFPPGTAPTFDGTPCFTDMVVNIDGNNTFAGFTYSGYYFPDVNTLVEASRGNLESNAVFTSSKANSSVSVAPKPGYQKAYFEAAAKQLKPMHEAQAALLTMTQMLNTDADTHFGFVAFDSTIGANPSSVENWYDIDDYPPYGKKQGYPIPHVVMSNTGAVTHYADVNTAINSCVPMGSTNIGAAVHAGVDDLKANARTGSARAIILFTDGEPTTPGGPLSGDPKTNARMAAVEAREAGVAVYTVGLAQNPVIIPDQEAILNDTNSDPTTGGMAAIAGHGGTFNLVTDSSELRATFAKIARRLVKLVSNP